MKTLTILLWIIIVCTASQVVAQKQDSLQIQKRKFINSKDFIVPGVLIGASLISLTDNEVLDNSEFTEERNEHVPFFRSHIDDYMQYAPIALNYSAQLFGAKTKSDLLNQTLLLAKSEIIMTALVLPLKYASHVERPDHSNFYSFPSGHTAQAFVAAAFLDKELGEENICYSIAGYTIASGVGIYRMLNNKHWASDVLAGAATGILSVNLAYNTHEYRWKSRSKNKMTFIPSYGNNSYSLSFSMSF